MTTKEQKTSAAIELHALLARIDITAIPVLSRDRCMPRKDRAKLVRQLFRQLGLKGISVTTPNYSMAQSVEVRAPHREDYTPVNGQIDWLNDPAAQANREARERLQAILLAAFPQHDDRSDIQTDYFDNPWSIS